MDLHVALDVVASREAFVADFAFEGLLFVQHLVALEDPSRLEFLLAMLALKSK